SAGSAVSAARWGEGKVYCACMPRPAILSCDNLTKAFGGPPLFEGLSFALQEGDHLGLVGPNGAGKSTLLKILGGVEAPDSGNCRPPYRGCPPADWSAPTALENRPC